MVAPRLVHSEFSPGFGSVSPERLVQRAAELGFEALALTDVENLRGQVRFHHAARAYGVHAVTGVTLRERGHRLVVLARDDAGYEALCTLVTKRSLDPSPERWAHVDSGHAGLLFLSDDPTTREFARPLTGPEIVLSRPEEAERHALRCAIHWGEPRVAGATFTAMSDLAPIDRDFGHLAAQCTLDLTRGPRESAPDSAARVLAEFARAADQARPPDARRSQRLNEELEVIERLGLSASFLFVAELVDAATELGISVSARGSVVSSLVGHLLGFSPVDPLAEGLLFERFVSEARTGTPTIDLEVPGERREDLIAWALQHLGEARAARVGTHVTLQRRVAWRAGLTAYGMGRKELDALTASMPSDGDWAGPPRLQGSLARVAPIIESLVGCFHHVAANPEALVVTPGRLAAHTALERASGDVVVTQLDAQGVEALGLQKVQLIGSRALSIIDAAQRLVPEVSDSGAEGLAALQSGDTLGVAQLERPSVRSALQAHSIDSRAEFTVALARTTGSFTGEVSHSDEDLVRLIASATRLPLGDADALRMRVIDGEDAEVRTAFFEHARAAGRPREETESAWRQVQRSASHGFSRADAASLAAQAWKALGLKLAHPAAFACAVLDHEGGAYPLRTLAADFQRHGVELRLPCINMSQPQCVLEGSAVRLGLSRVKQLRARTALRILENRPFYSLSDLFAEVPMTRSEREALVWSGACDSLPPLDADAYPLVHEDVLTRLASRQSFAGLPYRRLGGEKADHYRSLTRIKRELETLGMHVSAHPLAVLRSEAHRTHCIPVAHLHGWAGRRARFAGLVAASRRHRTEAGRSTQFITVEDETGLVEVMLAPAALAQLDPVSAPGPWLLDGLVETQGRAVRVQLIGARPFHQRAA